MKCQYLSARATWGASRLLDRCSRLLDRWKRARAGNLQHFQLDI
jgi:hypothetical protein